MPAAARSPQARHRLMLTVAVLMLLAAGATAWWSLRPEPVKVYRRTAFDFEVTWRCLECGFEQDARAGVGPRQCPRCGHETFYVCIRHACPRHGTFPVAFQYDQAGNPVQLKVADGPWVPYGDEEGNVNARCPRCGEFMMPAEAPRPLKPAGSAKP